MLILLAVLLLLSTLLSVVLVLAVRTASRRLGFMDHPLPDHPPRPPIPFGGGIAIFLTFLAPVLLGMLAVSWFHTHGLPAWAPVFLHDIQIYLTGALSTFGQLAVILAGAAVIVLLGLVDDHRRLSPIPKLVVEIVVAVAVVLAGVRVTAFVGHGLLGAVATVVWIVAIINAFNMLDNMDGLSAGVAAIIGVILAVVALQSHQFFIAALLAPLVGALLGFLVFNYPPASIYMGDAGSLFIGFMLSIISVLITFNEGPESVRPVILPLLVFSVPLYDMCSVILLRIRAGRRPWQGDRRHFSHRLVALGLSDRAAVAAIHLLTLGIGLSATLLYLITQPLGEVITVVQAVVILIVIVILEHVRSR